MFCFGNERQKLRVALGFVLISTGALIPASATPSLVLNLDTQQVLYAEDAGDPWYPASTTKLMTALVTFEALANKEVFLETSVVMSSRAMRQDSLKSGLEIGSVMTLEDALYAVLVGSANDVAVALAESVAGSEDAFAERMNATAQRLGMTASHFVNANGLFERTQQISARDLAILAREIYLGFPQYRDVFATSKVLIDGVEIKSYNELLTRLPGTVGMKTGFVCSSGRNIVALTDENGQRLLTVVLGATTGRERSERAAKLLTEATNGELSPDGRQLDQIANNLHQQPEDMRKRVCSSQSAAYEVRQNKRYPMGIGRNKSYLKAAAKHKSHSIHTWKVSVGFGGPLPNPKPK
ncbi:D-alanyl-D-alanine carboxypeptidase DacF precursor [Pseudovibrio axinellae]|uniref:D-alanyl-D-alanine carboxypeptidase DacF n=1 Tax=Pseudovibrio axinellae TaxID=989403 RepID=A0A165YEE1_9HYPH|nr:D-alanyl-D-alanine carboxypeptidase family protein [Pseudovibrio axinellae]KZL18769.1 D-alanyl-D-alanine carboxypeptidase DacF precursor [Pseudovibrio axinellae]SEP93492.1 D-alanyl-D-alanine carboxypeptidase [Pseudovibrio axinellae]